MASVLSEKPVDLGDLLKYDSNPIYTRESVTLTNSSGSEKTYPIGTPLSAVGVPIAAASIANVKGLLLEHVVLANGESKKVGMLARGPSVINSDNLPTKDIAAAADINMTNFKNAVIALGIICRTEPPQQTEQTA